MSALIWLLQSILSHQVAFPVMLVHVCLRLLAEVPLLLMILLLLLPLLLLVLACLLLVLWGSFLQKDMQQSKRVS